MSIVNNNDALSNSAIKFLAEFGCNAVHVTRPYAEKITHNVNSIYMWGVHCIYFEMNIHFNSKFMTLIKFPNF